MPNKRGFTLIEFIITTMIIAVLATIAIPSFLSFMKQGSATGAKNNLITIYNAQKSYYLANNSFCTDTTGAVANCGNSLANLNSNLATLNQPNPTMTNLNINDPNFNYNGGCTVDASGFACTATGYGITIKVTNTPIVLLGGAGCATYAGACNRSCAPPGSPNCPS